MSTTPDPSVAAASIGHIEWRLSHMSHFSDTASRLGRLNIASNRSSDSAGGHMAVITRSQTWQQEEQRQAASRAPRRPSRRPAPRAQQQQRVTPGPSRTQPRRASASQQLRQREESSEDEDDDGDDSDPDDPPPTTGYPLDPRVVRVAMRTIYSVFDATGWSPYEFTTLPDVQLANYNQSSKVLRDLVDLTARTIHNREQLAAYQTRVPLNGDFWGGQVWATLHARVERHMQRFVTAKVDAIRTLEHFRQIYISVEGMLCRNPYNLMRATFRDNLMGLLGYILDWTLRNDMDVREDRSAQHYAGGQYEYNIYMRFASLQQAQWEPFIEVFFRLAGVEGLTPFPQLTVDHLRYAYAILQQRQARGATNQSASELFRQLATLLQQLQIQP